MRDFESLGTKLGPRLARLVSQTIIATKRGLAPHEVRVRSKATQDVIDRAGHEVADMMRPLIELLTDDERDSLHPEMSAYLDKIASGEHQWQALAGALGGLSQGVLSQVLGNALAPVAYRINELGPALVADPGTQAAMWAAGIKDENSAQTAGQWQGIRGSELRDMMLLAETVPSETDLQEMVNRGLMTEGEARAWLTRGRIPLAVQNRILALRTVLLSPADLALAVLRGNVNYEVAVKIAAQSGVSAGDFDVLIGNTGEPPGPQELAEALRRGFIDEKAYRKGILESRIRNEWIPTLLKLRYSPMSVADAVNAVVQNHISAAEAATIADQNGLEPGFIGTLIATAGEPLSRTEMEQLYNRGLATKAEVLQALRESRLKDKYGELAFDLHVRLLEPRMLSSAVETGAISHEDAIKHAMQYGFSREDATILVGEGSARKLKTYKDRVVSAAEGLYEENAITKPEFIDIAKAMGFDQTEADFVYQTAEFRRQAKVTTSVINAIRSKYIGHHINKSQASGLLDAAGVKANQRDYLLGYWDIELSANVRQLTEAQIIRAMKKSTITPRDAADRLLRLGYSPGDAEILIKDA